MHCGPECELRSPDLDNPAIPSSHNLRVYGFLAEVNAIYIALRLQQGRSRTIPVVVLANDSGSVMSQKHEIDDDLDAAYVSRVRPHIERLAEAQEDVVLDFSKVEFVDSSGLGALVFLHKRLVSNGHKLKVVGLRGQPLQLFTNLHLVPVFCD
jgi:anti-anti-sigma factor